ncbi:uncharacterized protein N7482_010706 [Penicillium canariense]|uniref:Uncharacterized protein n=1 Tax=Penicillium canariense TaxID=189055 RepID=A0A9W9HPS0_9EURO|nr:uncharacterized protein N7482_010706 [Penicillium canariense]KAJ5151454.1 hypothetical protein N7482_010706 [Penicillium canariense]
MKDWSATVVALASTGIAYSPSRGSRDSSFETCRCSPGDACWPAPSAWASLNSNVGGRLVATVPIGSPSHDPTYNTTACAAL